MRARDDQSRGGQAKYARPLFLTVVLLLAALPVAVWLDLRG